MQRSLPLLVLLLLTLFAAGSATALNAVLSSFVAPSEEDLAATKPAAAAASAGNGGPSTTAAERPGAGRERVKSEREYLDAILGRNLFDPDAIASWNPNGALAGGGGGQALTDLKVRLVGTMVAEPAIYSAAFIAADSDKDSAAKGYSIGHKIQDAEIVAIEDLKVTLKRGDGRMEVLTASDDEGKGPSAAASSSSEGSAEGVEQLSDNEFVVDRAVIDQYLGDLEGLSKMGRALLHRGADGEFDGYRLSAIRRDTIADKLGIKNGDVIHSVNGQPLNSVQNAMGAYQTMQSQNEFEFEITRRGETQKLKYSIR